MKEAKYFFFLVLTIVIIGSLSSAEEFGYGRTEQVPINYSNIVINETSNLSLNSLLFDGYSVASLWNLYETYVLGLSKWDDYLLLAGGIMSGDINMGTNDITNILSTQYNITSCTSPESLPAGSMCWNPDEDTFNIVRSNGQIYQINKEIGEDGINREGSTIADGSPVYLSGASGDNPEFKKADGSNVSESAMVGILTTACDDGELCPVTVFGFVNGLDTSAWALGDKLYLNASSPGTLTNVIPTLPNNPIWLATVVRVHANQGRIFVNPQIDPSDGFLINDIYATGSISTQNISVSNTASYGSNPKEHIYDFNTFSNGNDYGYRYYYKQNATLSVYDKFFY